MTKVLAVARKVRKALVAAASVAVTVEAFSGTPTNVKAVAAAVLAVLATFGITFKVSNAA